MSYYARQRTPSMRLQHDDLEDLIREITTGGTSVLAKRRAVGQLNAILLQPQLPLSSVVAVSKKLESVLFQCQEIAVYVDWMGIEI